MVIKYKASNLIADFNLNAKTALTTLSELLGTEIKKSTVLTEEQANVAFEALSNKAKIENAAEYLSSAAKKQQEKQAEKPARDVKKEQPQKSERPKPHALPPFCKGRWQLHSSLCLFELTYEFPH